MNNTKLTKSEVKDVIIGVAVLFALGAVAGVINYGVNRAMVKTIEKAMK